MTVNYDQIAARYDAHRPSGSDLCFERLAAALSEASRILEIGAGTGNTTHYMAEKIAGMLVALEPSVKMTEQAHAKGVGGLWLRGMAPHLPFPNASFAAVYSSYVLQHIGRPELLFQDCARILHPGGLIAHITVPESYIASHPLNYYFPSFAKIDLGRFLPIENLVNELRAAGFSRIQWHVEQDIAKPIDRAYLARVESKFLSTFDLMSPEEYEEGCVRLRQDIETGGGNTKHAVIREALFIQARKEVDSGIGT